MKDSLIKLQDSNGITRVNLAAELPNPVVDGVERPRDVKVSGLSLQNSEGNEAGGFGTIDGQRATLLALDYEKHEAAVLFAADTPEGSATQLTMNEKVEFSSETGCLRDPTRIQLGVQSGTPFLSFKGKDGTERIRIAIDEDDNPVIEITRKDGSKIDLAGLDG